MLVRFKRLKQFGHLAVTTILDLADTPTEDIILNEIVWPAGISLGKISPYHNLEV